MKRIGFIICFFLLSISDSSCLIISSTYWGQRIITTPFFPASDNNNQISGFVVLEAGFTLEDNTTSCTFDSAFPIAGTINFNGGTLSILQDVEFVNTTTIATGGVINGNGNTVMFPSQTSPFTLNGPFTFQDATITLQSDVAVNGVVTFLGNCCVDINGYAIDLSAGSLAIAASSSLTVKNGCISDVSGTKISCAATDSTITFEDITLEQTADTTFSQGSFIVEKLLKIKGPYIFSYSSTQQSTINAFSHLFCDVGMTFFYDTNSASLIALEDQTACIHLHQATLHSGVPGLRLTKGTLIIQGRCPIVSDGQEENEGIFLGDGISNQNNLCLIQYAGSCFDIIAGFVTIDNMP